MSDFIRWKEFIKTSGYLSDAIKDFLESNIDKGFRNAALSRKEESVEDSSSSEELGDRANNLEIDEIMVLGEELAIDSRYRSSTRTERFQSMSDPDAIAKAAIETIGSLLGKLDNTALFQTLYSNLGDNENYKVKRAAINVMIMIIRNQQLTEDNQYIRLFKEKLAEYLLDSQLEDLARLGLRIADVSPKSSGESKEGELSTSGEIHIIHNSPPSPSKPSSRIAQKEIDKFLRLSMKDAVIQLKSTKGNAYQIAIKVLTDYLSTNPVWNKEDKWIERFDSLLDLLGYSEDITKQELKNLHKKVSQDIQNHIKLMNDSTHFWWINEHFIQLSMVARSEFKTVMEYVFYQALSDNKITSEEAKFISLCIRLQFAVAVAIPKTDSSVVEYSIEFDGIKHILSGSENAKHVNRIVRAAMDNNNKFEMADLFDNTGSGIVIAARDIKTATRSMVDKEMELSVGKAHISFLYLSDDERSEPKDAFLLLEKINDFGQYEAYKIFVNDEGEIESLNYRKHPNDLEELRIVIFGSMSSKITKVRYFTKTLEISLKLLGNIIGRINNKQDIPEASSPSGKSFLTLPFGSKDESEENKVELSKMEKLYDRIKGYFKDCDITGDWKVDLEKFSIHDKEDMIHLKDHQDSFRVDQRRENLERGRMKLEQKKIAAEIEALKKELNDFKAEINVNILTKLIEKEKLAEKDRLELEAIEADPYKYTVYRGIVEKMNAMYIAVKAISSERVKNAQNGALGITGNLLKELSKDVPLIGTAVGLLADILEAADDEMQWKMIKKYNKNMPLTGEKMSILSDLVARKMLAFELEGLAESNIDKVASIVTDAIEKGPATLLVQICIALKEEIQQDLGYKKIEEEQQEILGEMHVKIIFKIISEISFSNKYKNTVKAIKAQFGKIYHHKEYENEFEFEARAITKKVTKELHLHRKDDHGIDETIHRQSSLSDEEHKAEESVAVGKPIHIAEDVRHSNVVAEAQEGPLQTEAELASVSESVAIAKPTHSAEDVRHGNVVVKDQADYSQHKKAAAAHKPVGCTPFSRI